MSQFKNKNTIAFLMACLCVPVLSVSELSAPKVMAEAPKQSDYYTITEIPIPEEAYLEVSGIELLPDGKIAVCSRRGEIYLVENAFTTPKNQVKWTRFAQGLHEPLGLSWHKGWLWATQRCEITKIKDEDGDGRGDLFLTVNSDWGINGDYHEYAFGSRHDKDGNMWVVLCLSGSSKANSDFRGWAMRITEDGKMIPTASGVRSPGGIGANHKGDFFYSDNQGLWNGSSSVKHIKPGGFLGNPVGNIYYELTDAIGPRPLDPKTGSRIETEREKIKELVPPAVVMPHGKIGRSTSGIEYISCGDKFGPFKNQLLACDQNFSNVARLYLEEVNGVYQGAAFHFLKGFGSGNLELRMSPDGALFVGGTNRGWGSVGKKPYALERVNWTGKVPFEIHEMRIKPDGFELTFTKPIDKKSAEDLAKYTCKAYTYIYQKGYGSPEVDKSEPKVVGAKAAADGKSVRLKLEGMVKGHVHEMTFEGIKSKEGVGLLNPKAYYTINEMPK